MQGKTPEEKYIINLAAENEYPEHFNAEKEKRNIQTSTFIAFTVDFELRKLISNCNSSVTRMTPCLEKAYDNLFGSEYNNKVNNLCICYTACSGKICMRSKKSEKYIF